MFKIWHKSPLSLTVILTYFKRMTETVKGWVSKVRKINTALFLFAAALLIFTGLLIWGNNIGLTGWDKSALVIGLIFIVFAVCLLALFRPDSLLMTAEQRLELYKIERGDAEGGEIKSSYIQGEDAPEEEPKQLE